MAERSRRKVHFAYGDDGGQKNTRARRGQSQQSISEEDTDDGVHSPGVRSVSFTSTSDDLCITDRLMEEIDEGISDTNSYLQELADLKRWFEMKFQGLYLAFRGLVTAEDLVERSSGLYRQYSTLFLAYIYAHAAYMLEEEETEEEDKKKHHLYLRLHNLLAEISVSFLKTSDSKMAENSDGSENSIDYMDILRTFCTLGGTTEVANTGQGEDVSKVTYQFGVMTIGRPITRSSVLKESPEVSREGEDVFTEFYRSLKVSHLQELFDSFKIPDDHLLVFRSETHAAPSALIEHMASAVYQIVVDKISCESHEAREFIKKLETLRRSEVGQDDLLLLKYTDVSSLLKKLIWNCCENIDRRFTAVTSKFNGNCACARLLHVDLISDKMAPKHRSI